MIQLVSVTEANEAVYNLFEAAFPIEERRPWDKQLHLMAIGELRLLHILKDDVFAGFVFYWELPDFCFIDYFAILPAARGGGSGTQVMQLLEQRFSHIVLEVEPPLTEEAVRRIGFYERLGYQTFPQLYHQPPHHAHLPPLELRLMQKGMSSTDAAFQEIKDQLYKNIYSK
ncbi:GNAT family N-acetyltransferase [Chitinophaga nivalis]|uniref:GNAT family N-acetyltransferase n=1 Tax=Chitinophaga nivalis TaxID=2991709 RepID=A0ABT3ITS4_9BACT|nr:GNAT family N-acetyltransferase [Chitinophaga nivalis]MCW3463205.1 GNAT family N-acetyltransferase [Chitinophaga nivalis]MCW3487105.1 GNAT family N-acetyltransferase [Chitinophaga nivalis]